MKPHLSYVLSDWTCAGKQQVGYAKSPEGAYHAWKNRLWQAERAAHFAALQHKGSQNAALDKDK